MPETTDTIGVGELARRLKRAAEGVTGREWVQGEMSSFRRAASGHVYFVLKDEREEAAVDCVMYRFNAQRDRRHLRDGERVQVRGRATVWVPRGRLQFVCEAVRPEGRGALLEALEQLKQKLREEGLFDAEKKRPLPEEPRVVGVVTSAAGAAFHDIREVAFRRAHVRLVLSPARVQGQGAAASIVRALDLLARYPGLDVAIVGRGGGASEDLMAFNDESVVRRVATFPVPIVSAVGHEIDTSLTDLAADVRAATPSQAAELAVPDALDRLRLLDGLRARLRQGAQARLAEDSATLAHLARQLSDPRFAIADHQQLLDERALRLERFVQRSVARRRQRLESLHRALVALHPRVALGRARADLGRLQAQLMSGTRARLSRAASGVRERAAQLQSLSPLAVLGRGYAIATGPDGAILRDAAVVPVASVVDVRLHCGRLQAKVTRATPGEQP